MSVVTSFAPLSRPSATVLILGSMPGVASLRAQQYYAHPRNHFWPIMAAMVGFDASIAYEMRVQALTFSGAAVWDVLQCCVRPGSLDSSIQPGSRVASDFLSFFQAHPAVRLVCFNGAEAERSFARHVGATVSDRVFRYARLPSTSPAHAVAFDKKLEAWRAVLGGQIGASADGSSLCGTHSGSATAEPNAHSPGAP